LQNGQRHWSGIIHFVESRINSSILEGINSKVQLAKKSAKAIAISKFHQHDLFPMRKTEIQLPLISHRAKQYWQVELNLFKLWIRVYIRHLIGQVFFIIFASFLFFKSSKEQEQLQ